MMVNGSAAVPEALRPWKVTSRSAPSGSLTSTQSSGVVDSPVWPAGGTGFEGGSGGAFDDGETGSVELPLITFPPIGARRQKHRRRSAAGERLNRAQLFLAMEHPPIEKSPATASPPARRIPPNNKDASTGRGGSGSREGRRWPGGRLRWWKPPPAARRTARASSVSPLRPRS